MLGGYLRAAWVQHPLYGMQWYGTGRWFPLMDSNHHTLSQNQVAYH